MRKIIAVFVVLFALMAVSTGFAQTTGARSGPPDPNQFRLDPIATGFTRALYVTHAGDGSGRLFLVQQNGIIRVIKNGDVMPAPFLDVSMLISGDALGNAYTERGLLGLAFHPDYASNGRFYISYTEANSHDSIISSYTVSDNPDMANADSATILFREPQPYGNHNGGHIAFGPDGYMYVSLGDGGSAGDPLQNGQNPNTLLGTILRIDVDSEPGSYAIPPNNPFVGSDQGADEVWAYGLRNVWRFSFDRNTGDMYLGDVGQDRWEEINFEPAGSPGGNNYGWNALEATHPYSGAAVPTNSTFPVAEYTHAGGHCSVTGGYVYRGAAIPTMKGAYIFGDFCSGQMWSTYQDASGTWQTNPLIDTPYTISSFGEDEDGELYLVHYGTSQIEGQVLRFSAVR